MASYVPDSFAMVAFFRAEADAKEVEKILLVALIDPHQLYSCSTNAVVERKH